MPTIVLHFSMSDNLEVTMTVASLQTPRWGEAFENGSLKVPDCAKINADTGNIPYYFIGDEIFPLKTWLVRPYPEKALVDDEEKKIFNYRQSRARRVIKNAFGILRARWRIFHKPIVATVENVETYTVSCLALQNYLRKTDSAIYTPQG